MRSRATAPAALCLALCLSLAVGVVTAQVSQADDQDVPTRAEVDEAEQAVVDQTTDVASLQAALADANTRLQASAIAAAQAGEAFNGARYEAALARAAAGRAEAEERAALADVARLRDTYASSVVTSVQSMPALTAIAGVAESDGILEVLERMDTMRDTASALDDKYDDFRAASARARGASEEAAQARAVGAEDDRHVAGEIHRADGIGVIVQVGRMQPRLAAVGARPLRLRADEADAGSSGIVVDFPFCGEKGVDVFIEEKIG